MKTYLVTYYFTNGQVYAVRYENQDFSNKENFMLSLTSKTFLSNGNDIINLSQVCRFTIDELEGDEQ